MSLRTSTSDWIAGRLNAWRLRGAYRALDRYPIHPNAPRHALPGELIISLTSFPPRFPTLHLTLKSLLDQKVRPDRILLWIADGDMAQLPANVLELQGDIFEVRSCEDLRSFKKILPTFRAYPNAFILIADDDTYYAPDWLPTLVAAFDPDEPTMVCHRAHQVVYDADGELAPYAEWPRNVTGAWTLKPRTDLLPTGNGGVLYPPGSLPPETSDLDLIRKLSATSDDVWLFFMWHLAGWKVRRAGRRKWKFVEWPRSQLHALRDMHRTGRKDEHLQDMSRHFGVPR